MSIRTWWKAKSGAGKALMVLAVLLTLQIGLCIATPALTQRWDVMQHKPAGEGWGTFGLLLWELLFCVANVVAMVIAGVWWLIALMVGRRKAAERTND
jgi:hypothetical protein